MTGAGISAESGLATFRGAGGLWDGQPVERVATPEGFATDPALVWRFYSQRRAQAAAAAPNRAHRALAALEDRLGDRFLLATQNVDGLHQRAGSRRVVEMHGSLWRTRCAVCPAPPFDDRTPVEPPQRVHRGSGGSTGVRSSNGGAGQTDHRVRQSDPCNSTTRRLPARWWRPSTFCVASRNRSPR